MRRFLLFVLSLATAAVGALAWTRRDDLKRTWGEWQAATANAGKDKSSSGPRVNGPVPGSEQARVAPSRSQPKPAPPAAPASVDAAPANENATPPRCAAETRGGKRCSREAEPGSKFCWQHG
jgi:hypothetical protein